jgi:ATP-dependent DNA helicase RecG
MNKKPKTKFSIFISSVMYELKSERRAIKDYITNDPILKQFFNDVFLFEDIPARKRSAKETFLSEVANRDIYLGLFGKEYGQKNSDGVSATHEEFITAIDSNRELLIYIVDSSSSKRDHDMEELIKQAGTIVTRKRVHDLLALLREVHESLADFIRERGLLKSDSFESSPCIGTTLKDVDLLHIHDFLDIAQTKGRLNFHGSRSVNSVLLNFRLLVDKIPSNAAILLFGKSPSIYTDKSRLHCLQFYGTLKQKPIAAQQVFEGTLFETIDSAVGFVSSRLSGSVGIAHTGAKAPVEPEIPHSVIRESIVNAVAHRDYGGNGFIQVIVFSDRIEIWNPGKLPSGLSPEKLREPHGPIPRNPLIAEPLFRAGYSEKAGTGTTDMIADCRKAEIPEPDFRQNDSHFIVTLWRNWLTEEFLNSFALNDYQIKAIAFLKQKKRISNAEYQNLSGVTARTALRHLKDLVEKGLVEKSGLTGRSAHYRISKRKPDINPTNPT